MIANNKFIIIFLFLSLQACTRISAPYSTVLQSVPTKITTSVGNVEVLKMGEQSSKGTVYLIPGFPGSSLENASLGHELMHKGYSVRLINPPGHGQIAIGNARWNNTFQQYGQALYESIQKLEESNSTQGERMIIAHSAGAEMVFQLFLKQTETDILAKRYRIVLINPWLPSVSNYPIPWTSDDEDILKYPSWLVKLLGPASKSDAHKRLFFNPHLQQNTAYLDAHEKLTENLGGWWPFDSRFVRLMKETTRTQRAILQQGKGYELTKSKATHLNKTLNRAKVRVLVINSSNGFDSIIPDAYKRSLKKALRSKFPNSSIRFSQNIKGGHMLQVERIEQVVNRITE